MSSKSSKSDTFFYIIIGILSVIIIGVFTFVSVMYFFTGYEEKKIDQEVARMPRSKTIDDVKTERQAKGISESVTEIQTAKSQEVFINFSNVSFKETWGMFEMIGEVTNDSDRQVSFTFTASFYDENNSLIGTALGAMNQLNGGETKTFSAIGSDIGKFHSYKIQVDYIY